QRQVTLVGCAFSLVGEGAELVDDGGSARQAGLRPQTPIDVEEADSLIAHGRDLCARAAGRFRGHLAGGLGGQALFRFGFPAAEGAASRRAARAALAMIAAIEEDALERAAEHRPRLAVRIGIHTGIVVSQAQGGRSAQRSWAGLGLTAQIAVRLSELGAP